MPFNQYPLPMPVNPVVRNPTRAFMRGTIIVAADPDVVIALVLVIARNPNISALGRRTGILINGSRWPNANHNLRHGGHRTQVRANSTASAIFFTINRILQE
jgi:hypothetical protein